MIEFSSGGSYRPICVTLWNGPAPAPVCFEAGDILVSVENIRDKDGVWGWRYIILRPLEDEKK